MKRHAPATKRNREPIRDVLRRFVSPGAHVLEIASGSGEHAVFLAHELGVASWQPTDLDPDALASIDAWRAGADLIAAARRLDVTERPWPTLPPTDVVFCANMIHIAPWRATEGLLSGAGSLLGPGGWLILYGPYKREGRHTAPSNEEFDASLRGRDPSWGVRDLEAVVARAEAEGFALVEVAEMPANNLTVVLKRR